MTFVAGQRVWLDETHAFAKITEINPSGTLAKIRYEHPRNQNVYIVDVDALTPAELAVMPPMDTSNLFNVMTYGQAIPDAPAHPNPDLYVPQITFNNTWSDNKGFALVTLAIRANQCPSCGRLMIDLSDNTVREANIDQQLEYTDIKRVGAYSPHHRAFICDQCLKEGRATFICGLCGIERNITEVAYEYRDNYLCHTCYETVSAKEWQSAIDRIMDKYSDDR